MTKPIYHGTVQKGLDTIKPFKRFTPGGPEAADAIPPRIYATYKAAFAVAHSFPWSSDDGIDITTENNDVTIVVPEIRKQVLEQPVCIYTLPDDTFSPTLEEETGLTYHSEQVVTPIESTCYASVTEAMEALGGRIELI